jgi:hypothetical protein
LSLSSPYQKYLSSQFIGGLLPRFNAGFKQYNLSHLSAKCLKKTTNKSAGPDCQEKQFPPPPRGGGRNGGKKETPDL